MRLRLLAYCVLLALAGLPAEAGDPAVQAACVKVKQQIRVLEARMRSGYSAAQGIRYDARLRKLKEKRYRLCRQRRKLRK